jgi:hypothetical protein
MASKIKIENFLTKIKQWVTTMISHIPHKGLLIDERKKKNLFGNFLLWLLKLPQSCASFFTCPDNKKT